MASNEGKDTGPQMLCVLKLDTSAKTWHRTISKVLKTIEGVSYSIDMEAGKVTVMGTIDPQALLRRLGKSGKHAELLSVYSGTLLESWKTKQKKKKEKDEYEETKKDYLKYIEEFGPLYAQGYPQQYGYANGYNYPQQYGYANGYNYPQHYGYYNHNSGAGYPYGTTADPYGRTADYYGSTHHQLNANYYYQQQQPYRPTATPQLGFPQPPPPLEIHPFYDPDTSCTIM